jgi:hypothetical protein
VQALDDVAFGHGRGSVIGATLPRNGPVWEQTGKMRAGRDAGGEPLRNIHQADLEPRPSYCDFSATAPCRCPFGRNSAEWPAPALRRCGLLTGGLSP